MNAQQQRILALALAGLSLSSTLGPEAARAPRPSADLAADQNNTEHLSTGDLHGSVEGAYWSDRLLVRLRPGASLDQVAVDHGTSVLRAAGASGLATLRVPEGRGARDLLAALRADPRVVRAAASGRVTAAGTASPASYQWHRPLIGEGERSVDASGITVAVLDTGVAHAAGCTAAPGLDGVEVVAPHDLVHEGGAACDDHQHGTHIASLIASQGDLLGVAPGVAIMPVKVLDEDSLGDEQALIDGIDWAVDEGADVINLSLSFDPTYTPSPELQIALRRAHDAGILLVAAAGNNGGSVVTWPAASPLVIAVGAGAPNDLGGLSIASYADRGPEVDLMAPGGELTADFTHDGYGDGVLAETINPDAPSTFGYWFYEGSSQAAALVSGAAAALLALGVPPEDVLPTLQTASSPVGNAPYLEGLGAGALNLGAALDLVAAGETAEGRELHASILPFLASESSGSRVRPRALVAIVDEDGDAVGGATVVGRVDGAEGPLAWRCETANDGTCEISGDAVDADGADGAQLEAAWRFSVDVVSLDGVVGHAPTAVVFATDRLEALSAGLAEADLDEATLAFGWPEGTDSHLGAVAASTTILDPGRGGASPPSALLMTSTLADRVFSFSTMDVDTSGSGVATDALGLTFERSTSGSGVATDALGIGGESSATRVSASGVATDALSLTALAMTGNLRGESYGLGMNSAPVFPGEDVAEEQVGDTWIQEAFDLAGEPAQPSLVESLRVSSQLDLVSQESEATVQAAVAF